MKEIGEWGWEERSLVSLSYYRLEGEEVRRKRIESVEGLSLCVLKELLVIDIF